MPCLKAINAAMCGTTLSTSAIDQWQPLMVEASNRFGIPVVWIRAAICVESGGQRMLSGVPITSLAGAMGLMQVMPDTYA